MITKPKNFFEITKNQFEMNKAKAARMKTPVSKKKARRTLGFAYLRNLLTLLTRTTQRLVLNTSYLM